MLLDRDSELLKLRQENKKLNYLHIENLNLLKQIQKLKGNNSLRGEADYSHSSHPFTDQNSGSSINQQPQQHVIGKWKKPSNASTTPNSNAHRHGRREFSRQAEFSIENELAESQRPQPMRQSSLPQSSLSIDECLTIQQRRKEQLESQLNKLTNIKKLTPMERRAIDELERDLYEVNSQIAGLKRKIRHRY